jgi:hypothetical protein
VDTKKKSSRSTPETLLVQQIFLRLGKRNDLRIWRQNSGALPTATGRIVKFGTPGAADLSGILEDGRRIEIEIKTPSGRQSEQQKRFQEMIEKFNGIYILARSVEDAERGIVDAKSKKTGLQELRQDF